MSQTLPLRVRFVPDNPAADEIPDEQVAALNARDPQGCAHVEIVPAIERQVWIVRVFSDRSVTVAGDLALDRWEYGCLIEEIEYARDRFEACAKADGLAAMFKTLWAPPGDRD